ncbi:hypothetical protein AQUCO_05100082v1 [Aquilegia coerulea]|uniref:Uncharacterized protein n=1 Tax=Aquilegia coerulea TaxID=218851 RepID=A0A2G5CJ20_AQUCA|nr:hypothetical protein AQUCO_05100082v1 [Aquilegia coerulea]
MDLVNPLGEIVSRVMDCSTKHLNYLRALEEKLNQLREKMAQLNELKIDVNNRVISEESRLMVRTNQVNGWMQRVEASGHEVDRILLEGGQHLERRCLNGCCPMNCWSSYKLGKKVVKKLRIMEELKRDGDFDIVAENPPRALVQELPESSTVGLDSVFGRVWSLLGENGVRIIGLYGMGGVGKTTLLKKINNELGRKSSDFDIVIWVVISKEANMTYVQELLGKNLGLSWSESVHLNSRANDIFNVLKTKKFLIFLDDIWERIDLPSIGVPPPSFENKSKIMFTTRSEEVCGLMEVDKKVRVECLSWDEAWTLFQEKVGQAALSSDIDIPKLAEIVAQECRGLPLALITIGRSMASKKTCQQWKHAISVLRNSAAEFPGMGDNVLPLLKFSYDALPNDTVRLCFLFCSLYPEDYSIFISNLIHQWIGEGYITGFDSFDEALNTGHYIIGVLKDTCLLEEGDRVRNFTDTSVKMHDVIRDLALWIACECGREKDKYFVKAGVGLLEAPKTGKLPTMAEKISLFGNNITQLGNIPKCPNLTTLLVSGNHRLEDIHNDFFLSMPALKFLDLSETIITKLPTSICELLQLEFLDLTFTRITSLPYELRKLTKLKYLALTRHTIPREIIPNLLSLEILKLDLKKSDLKKSDDSDDEMQVDIEELACLNQLKSLEITIFSGDKEVEKFLSYPQLANSARTFKILTCNEITSLTLSAASSCSSNLCLGHLKKLRGLYIGHCSELEELKFNCINKETTETGLYESLEIMTLFVLPKLIISCEVSNNLSSTYFRKLRFINLYQCDAMADLNWLLLIPNIQRLSVSKCHNLQEILSSDESGGCDETTFAYLKELDLSYLPNLCSICRRTALPFPSLETIYVLRCPKLRRLPLDSNSAKNTFKHISGNTEWWNRLEWESETYARFLKSYGRASDEISDSECHSSSDHPLNDPM